jgi:hypothetical protein
MREELRRVTDRLMKLPHVVGVDIDSPGGHDRILVFVDSRFAAAEQPTEERIPETIEGYPVEIVESGPLTAEERDDDGRSAEERRYDG